MFCSCLTLPQAVDANLEALDAHMRGLKRLIHLLGGLDALDHMTLSKVYQYVPPLSPTTSKANHS
jgi:hypothetical protein